MSRRITKKQRQPILTHDEYVSQSRPTIKLIDPLTKAQDEMMDIYERYDAMAALGSTGTGKSYVALGLALNDVLNEKLYEKIIIVRTAVATRDMGHMPGDINEKMSYYETPYIDIVDSLSGKKGYYKTLKERGVIQFMTTSYVRGLTFENAVIIYDEVQSSTYHEIKSVYTRLGSTSKIVFCGDYKQDDLATSKNRNEFSGLKKFMAITNLMKDFGYVHFTKDDIVRSGNVKSFIIAEEEYEDMAA